MATIEEVEYVFKRLNETRPMELNDRLSEIHFGIGAVLKILDESGGAVTCGEIAKKMNVSTARVAVLLKKLEAKGLIQRQSAKSDARIVYISMSSKGKDMVDGLKDMMNQHISRIIDEIGMEKLKTFLDLSDEIKEIAHATRPQMIEHLKKFHK